MSHSPARFQSTRWSLVLRAVASPQEAAEAPRALAELCEQYWPPLYAFARRRGLSREQAEDRTQEFFARLIERRDLAGVDPERGRFRSYLLGAMRHFLAKAQRSDEAHKRGGPAFFQRVDFEQMERSLVERDEQGSPAEHSFDRDWALHLLERSLDDLRRDARDRGREESFEQLLPALNPASAPPLREMAEQTGQSEGAIKVAVHRLRQRYREAVRQRILETVAGPEQVDDEIRDLFSALGSGGA